MRRCSSRRPGNTALQSVMPAIGREIGIADFWVAVAYTWSAVLWVAARAVLGGEERPPRAQGADPARASSGFIVSMLLCGLCCTSAWRARSAGGLTFILFGLFRAIYGSLGCATPSATQAYLASKTRRSGRVAALSALSSSFGLGTIIGPAVAPLFVLPVPRACRAVVRFLADRTADLRRHPAVAARTTAYGRRTGHGAAMSYPSLASQPTGASVVAATSPRAETAEVERPAHPAVDHRRRGRRAMRRRRCSPAWASSSSTGSRLEPRGSEWSICDRDDGGRVGDARRRNGA